MKMYMVVHDSHVHYDGGVTQNMSLHSSYELAYERVCNLIFEAGHKVPTISADGTYEVPCEHRDEEEWYTIQEWEVDVLPE